MAFVMLKKVSIISTRYSSIFRHKFLINENPSRSFFSSNYFPTFSNKVNVSYQENNLNIAEADAQQNGEVEKGYLNTKTPNMETQLIAAKNLRFNKTDRKPDVFVTKSSYLQYLNEVLSKNETISSPTAFKIIKSCGSDMSAENESTRNELVTNAWEILKNNGTPLGIGLWNTLLSVYIENKREFDPVDFLNDLRKCSNLEPNQTTFSLLIQMYAGRGDPPGVMKIIEFMMDKNFTMTENMYAWLIQAFATNGNFEGVKHVMKSMRENGIPPKEKTYKQIINALAFRGDLGKIEETLNEMTKKGVSPTVELYLSLLDHLSEGGHSNLIQTTLEKIDNIQGMSLAYHNLIQRCTVREDYDSAIAMMKHLGKNQANMKPYTLINQVSLKSYKNLLLASKDLEQLKKFNNLLEKHFDKELNSRLPFLAEYLTKNDKLDWALKLVVPDEVLKKNLQLYYSILKALDYKQDMAGIVKVFADMGDKKIAADHYCYVNVFETIGEAGSEKNNNFLDLAKKFDNIVLPYELIDSVLSRENMNLKTFSEYAHLGSVGDLLGSIKEITDLIRRDFNLEDALKIVRMLHKREVQTKVLIDKVVTDIANQNVASTKQAYLFMMNLIQEGIPTSSNAQYNILNGLFKFFRASNSEYFLQFIRTLKEHGIEPDSNQQILMIRMAAKIGNSSAAQFCFEKLMAAQDLPDFYNEKKNLLYQYLISAYQNEAIKDVKEKKLSNALKILQIAAEMKEKNIKPTSHSASVIAISYLINGDVAAANDFLSEYGSLEQTKNQRNLLNTAYLTTLVSQGNFKAAESKFKDLLLSKTVSLGHFKQMFRMCEIKGNVLRMESLQNQLVENGMTPDVFIYEHLIRTYLKVNQPEKCLKLLNDNITSKTQKLGVETFMTVIRHLSLTGVENVFDAIEVTRKVYPNVSEQAFNESIIVAHIKSGLIEKASSYLNKNKDEKLQAEDTEITDCKNGFIVGPLKKNADSAQKLGDIEFIENIIKFLKANKLPYHVAYPSYLLALDKTNDIERIRNLYKDRFEDGVKENDQFISLLNAVAEKHGLTSSQEN